MATKICKKEKEKSKSIIVNGIEYKPYKRSKDIFLEQCLEDEDRKHIHFLLN